VPSSETLDELTLLLVESGGDLDRDLDVQVACLPAPPGQSLAGQAELAQDAERAGAGGQ